MMKTEVKTVVEIDGSQGEGGGQILRTALALSLITGQAFSLVNIRAKRPKPGLMRQHLACVQAAVAAGGGPEHCQALDADGNAVQIGASQLRFTPGPVRGGDYEFAVGSAGSCMLVLQTVLWPLVLAAQPSNITLRGGTHNPMAPSATFLSRMAPYFSGGGQAVYALEVQRHGFYPAGGGEVRVRIAPPPDGLAAIHLMERGARLEAWAECLHAGIPKGVAGDLPPTNRTSYSSKKSINPENDGHENKQIQRRADHWFPAAGRGWDADQGDRTQTWFQ